MAGMTQLRRAARQRGQGLVEYAMGALLAVIVLSVIQHQINKTIGKLWLGMAKDIAAGCPGCTPPDSIR